MSRAVVAANNGAVDPASRSGEVRGGWTVLHAREVSLETELHAPKLDRAYFTV